MMSVRKNLIRRIRKQVIEDYRKNFRIAMAEAHEKGNPLLGALFIFAGVSAVVCLIFGIK